MVGHLEHTVFCQTGGWPGASLQTGTTELPQLSKGAAELGGSLALEKHRHLTQINHLKKKKKKGGQAAYR